MRARDYGWLYLHYLDRELLTTCGLYGQVSPRRVQDDFILSLLAIHEPAYVSMSVLFESDYAFDIFSKYRILFSRPDILRLAGTHDHLGGFILCKREDYRPRQARYPRYFSDIWKDVEDVAPAIAVKRQDTTQYLRGRLMRCLSDPSAHGAVRGIAPYALIGRIVECLQHSDGAPVTADLFAPICSQVLAEPTGRSMQQLVSLQISMAYVESYMNEYRGTIPCGLRSGLRIFDKLSRTFPTHCLDIWREAYTALGIYPHVLSATVNELIEIRNLAAHAAFVSAVRRLLERSIKASGTAQTHDAWEIASDLTHRLPRRYPDRSTSLVGSVANALEQGATVLCRELLAAPEPLGTRPHSNGLYLDIERGALRASGGTTIDLEPGAVRVLFALAGEVPGHSRRAALGQLSDQAVADLYVGNRLPRTPAEVTTISYQFMRALRRRLSSAGFRERDAIVRRLRGRGIAMGARWAKPAVRGKSEIGLIIGRWRDAQAFAVNDDDDTG